MKQRIVSSDRAMQKRAIVRPVKRVIPQCSVVDVVRQVVVTRKPARSIAQQYTKTPVADIRIKPIFNIKPRLMQLVQNDDMTKPAHKISITKKALQPLRPAQPLFQSSNLIKSQRLLQVVTAPTH